MHLASREDAATKEPGETRRAGAAVTTLRDVAAMAGVSLMTASIVANGRGGRVSGETRDRVAAAISELGYRPNARARSLRLARGNAVGMIVLDASPRFLAAPFTTNLMAGLSNRLGESEFSLTIQGLLPSMAHQALALRTIGSDGLCVLTAGSMTDRRRFLDSLAAVGMPIVLFEETLDSGLQDVCSICQDDRGGGRLLGEHVLQRGARSLLMLVPGQEWPSIDERRTGILEAARAHGDVATLQIVHCGDEGMTATRAALLNHLRHAGLPDAILAGNDQMGIAALQTLKAEGITVPRDVMVTGFNGFDFRDYSDPLLTTVRSAAYDMGAAAGDALLHRLKTGGFERGALRLPVHLLPGDSTPAL